MVSSADRSSISSSLLPKTTSSQQEALRSSILPPTMVLMDSDRTRLCGTLDTSDCPLDTKVSVSDTKVYMWAALTSVWQYLPADNETSSRLTSGVSGVQRQDVTAGRLFGFNWFSAAFKKALISAAMWTWLELHVIRTLWNKIVKGVAPHQRPSVSGLFQLGSHFGLLSLI